MDAAAGAVGALVLAAGRSTRLGRPKQLLPLGGRPLLQHAIDSAAAAGLAQLVVVLGHAAEEIAAAIVLPRGALAVVSARHAEGQSASLGDGLHGLAPDIEAALVLLGDQPTVGRAAIRAVAGAFRADGAPVVRARYGGRPGHPVLIARRLWPRFQELRGDRGARDLLDRHPEWVIAVDLPGAPPPDVDTWEDYRRLMDACASGRPPR